MVSKNNSVCPICKDDKGNIDDRYCNKHLKAKKEIQQGYESWLKAYSILSWEDYLKQLIDLGDRVGNLIRDVVEYEFYFKEN